MLIHFGSILIFECLWIDLDQIIDDYDDLHGEKHGKSMDHMIQNLGFSGSPIEILHRLMVICAIPRATRDEEPWTCCWFGASASDSRS